MGPVPANGGRRSADAENRLDAWEKAVVRDAANPQRGSRDPASSVGAGRPCAQIRFEWNVGRHRSPQDRLRICAYTPFDISGPPRLDPSFVTFQQFVRCADFGTREPLILNDPSHQDARHLKEAYQLSAVWKQPLRLPRAHGFPPIRAGYVSVFMNISTRSCTARSLTVAALYAPGGLGEAFSGSRIGGCGRRLLRGRRYRPGPGTSPGFAQWARQPTAVRPSAPALRRVMISPRK